MSQANAHISSPAISAGMSPSVKKFGRGLYHAGKVLGLLFVFLVAIRALGTGFESLGGDTLDSFFRASANPFVGLAVGILATTLVQSSSVTTSMIVALVAAPGSPLSVSAAIPMIMGANIGTTVTNTIVSLGHAKNKDEFRPAFGAATCHDFFNLMAVLVFLPLEMATGFLEKTSHAIAGALGGTGGAEIPNPIKDATKAVEQPLSGAVTGLVDGSMGGVLLIGVSAIMIFGTLSLLVRVLKGIAGGEVSTVLRRALGKHPIVGVVVGALVTIAVQSSSITTSVLVPMAGAGILGVRQIFPVTVGANIGTTMTALLASMAAPAETAHLAIQIASVHFLFNIAAAVLILPFVRIRDLPVKLAEMLAGVAVRSRLAALGYVVALFYAIPALLVFITRA